MSNTLGTNLKLTVFGESHGEYIGATLDGLSAGIKVDYDYINSFLKKRRPLKEIETGRVEEDDYKLISGIFNGYTTGSPLTVLIKNENVNSKDYEDMKSIARPSHADYVSFMKYHGFNDYRGGGHFSGRITASIVALGAIVSSALEKKGILIGTHIKKCGSVEDVSFSCSSREEIIEINKKTIPTILDIEEKINAEIKNAAKSDDSIGGILQTCINGLPVGLGDPLFDSVESRISSALFSIGGIKGVEFGLGFEFANRFGSTCNDEFVINDGKITTKTNNNGGINAGISNGNDVIFSCVIKPTPSIGKIQNTIDFVKKEDILLTIKGRHDPAFIRRVAIVVTSITAITVADLLITKYGSDYFYDGE